jgi:hypothetical protein
VQVKANTSVFADKLIYSIENAYPPATAPQHVRVLWGVKNTLKVLCDSVWNATGYVAYLSEDGETFTDSVVSAGPEIMIPRRPSGSVTYVKVRAFNEFGYSPVTRDLYAAIPSSYRHQVLLVDGFDRSTNTRHDYMRFYAEPLLNRGIAFSSTLNETIYEDKLSLEGFDTVIWILGDESSADDTFNPAEQERVKTFLKNGGQLLVSGAEIGWDLEGKSGHPSPSDKAFYHDFLKARYVNDAPLGRKGTYYRVDGLAATFAEGLTDVRYDNGSQGTINVDWPDAVEPLDGAQAVFQFQSVSVNNGVAGIAYEGLFPDGTKEGKLVYLTFPFETVFPQSSRETLMDRIFDFFEGTVSVSDPDKDSRVQQFALNPVYPNPFNASTTISFTLPPGSHTVQVSVYDITGRRVRTLMSGRQSGGAYRLVWDGTGSQGRLVSSGVYTVRIQTDEWRDVRQMTLVK